MKKTLAVIILFFGFVIWQSFNSQNDQTILTDDTEELEVEENLMVAEDQKNTHSKKSSNSKDKVSKKKELDKLGEVFNQFNTNLSEEEMAEIKVAKAKYDQKEKLKQKILELERSYFAKNFSLKELKNLQNEIVEIKKKLGIEINNIEKWDPKFVYYLIINDNYSLNEINQMKNLAEHGLSQDEVEYIKEYTQTTEFKDRLDAFKNNGETVRKTASLPKEKDEFIETDEKTASLEEKLIEMNYNQDEKEEMSYGFNQ